LNTIRGPLTIDGGANPRGGGVDNDSLFLDDYQDSANNTGTLTNNSVTGLGMISGSLTYRNFEILTIGLGSGSDTFTISSTHAGFTELNAGPNPDVINVRAISGPTRIN